MVAEKKPLFEFMIRRMLAGHDLETVEGRVAALRAAAPVVLSIRDTALHAGYVRDLARWLGLDPREVQAAVNAARARSNASSARPEHAASARPEYAASARPEHAASARPPGSEPPSDAVPAGPTLRQLPGDPATRLERDALMAILQHPEQIRPELVRRASQVAMANASLAVVRDAVAASLPSVAAEAISAQGWLDRVIAEVPAPFAALVAELGMAPIPEQSGRDLAAYCTGVTVSLIERDLLRIKAELLGRLQRTDSTAEQERYREIQRSLMSVEAQRRALRAD
jgi:DNA primase